MGRGIVPGRSAPPPRRAGGAESPVWSSRAFASPALAGPGYQLAGGVRAMAAARAGSARRSPEFDEDPGVKGDDDPQSAESFAGAAPPLAVVGIACLFPKA